LQLLAHAFRSLSQRGAQGGQGYLADDPARETFAQGLVEVLNCDVGIRSERRRFGDEDTWRPSSRNEAFPPLGSDRPVSRTADRWTSSRPASRTDNRFPGSRPDSRSDMRFPSLGSDRQGPGSRPDSSTGDRFSDRWAPSSRPESRTGDRVSDVRGGDRWTPKPDSRASRYTPADVRSSLPPGNGFSSGAAADRYRPDPRIQGKWR
jgi:hypothetical protein